MDPYFKERAERLTREEQREMMEFLENLTEGDIIKIGKESCMTHKDARAAAKAIEKFNEP